MNELKYKVASKEDAQGLLHYLLDNFMANEPTCQSLQMSRDDGNEFFKDLVDDCIVDPVSAICYNETNETVGCLLNRIVHVGSEKIASDQQSKSYSKAAQFILKYLDELTKDLKVFLPNSDKVIEYVILSVHSKYQRRGIAQRLLEMSTEKAKEIGCDFVITEATSYNSQQLFKKLGFQTLKIVQHADFCDESGRRIFQAPDATDCGQLMVQKLH